MMAGRAGDRPDSVAMPSCPSVMFPLQASGTQGLVIAATIKLSSRFHLDGTLAHDSIISPVEVLRTVILPKVDMDTTQVALFASGEAYDVRRQGGVPSLITRQAQNTDAARWWRRGICGAFS